MSALDSFTGQYRWLSNFWTCGVYFAGTTWPSSEHAYAAMKVFTTPGYPEKRGLILSEPNPAAIKRMSKKFKLRENWDARRLDTMLDIVRAKFKQNPHLRQKLLETGDRILIEGNGWGDTFWGICRGEGENHLGKILMEVRDELREESFEESLA